MSRRNNKTTFVRYNASVYRRFVLFRFKREGICIVGDLKPKSCTNGVLFKEHIRLFGETAKISCRRYFETGELKPLEVEKKKKTEYVYVFVNIDFGVCKIGFSNNPSARLAQVQTGCPFKLKRQLMIVGGAEKEAELHRKYKKFRLEGEWFAFRDELKEDVMSNNIN